MKTNLQFDFSVDKENNTITVVREFAAPLEKVWAAWTTADMLNKWWAPKPYVCETKNLDFKPGGYWLYSMKGPGGDVHWSRADYKSVEPMNSYSQVNTFCDENGVINESIGSSQWTHTFTANGDHTIVNIHIKYNDLSTLERMLEMGFQGGFTMGLANLDKVLAS